MHGQLRETANTALHSRHVLITQTHDVIQHTSDTLDTPVYSGLYILDTLDTQCI